MSILGVPAAAPSISGRPETLEARNGGAAGPFRWPEPLEIGKLYPALLLSTPVNVAGPPIRSSMALAAPAKLLVAAGKSRAMNCLRIDRTVPHEPPQVSSPGSGHEVGWQNPRHLPEKRCFRDEVRWQSSLEPASVYHYEAGWQRLPAEKMPWKSTSIEVRWQSDARPAGNSTEAPWHRPRGRLQTRPEVRWENERGALAILARCAGKKHPLSHCT